MVFKTMMNHKYSTGAFGNGYLKLDPTLNRFLKPFNTQTLLLNFTVTVWI